MKSAMIVGMKNSLTVFVNYLLSANHIYTDVKRFGNHREARRFLDESKKLATSFVLHRHMIPEKTLYNSPKTCVLRSGEVPLEFNDTSKMDFLIGKAVKIQEKKDYDGLLVIVGDCKSQCQEGGKCYWSGWGK